MSDIPRYTENLKSELRAEIIKENILKLIKNKNENSNSNSKKKR